MRKFTWNKDPQIRYAQYLYEREKILKVYEEAIREEYRFFSYGDAMLIE